MVAWLVLRANSFSNWNPNLENPCYFGTMDSHGLSMDCLYFAIWADSLIRIQHCLQYLIQVHVPTLGGSWYGILVVVLSTTRRLVG